MQNSSSDMLNILQIDALSALDLPKMFDTANPFAWMSQATDLNKEKNFFETRVTEYQSAGSIEW